MESENDIEEQVKADQEFSAIIKYGIGSTCLVYFAAYIGIPFSVPLLKTDNKVCPITSTYTSHLSEVSLGERSRLKQAAEVLFRDYLESGELKLDYSFNNQTYRIRKSPSSELSLSEVVSDVLEGANIEIGGGGAGGVTLM